MLLHGDTRELSWIFKRLINILGVSLLIGKKKFYDKIYSICVNKPSQRENLLHASPNPKAQSLYIICSATGLLLYIYKLLLLIYVIYKLIYKFT